MRQITLISVLLATGLLPAPGHAAGYKFTQFVYPNSGTTTFTGIDDYNRIIGLATGGIYNVQGFMIAASGALTTLVPPPPSAGAFAVPYGINRTGGVVGLYSPDAAQSSLMMFVDNSNGYSFPNNDLTQQTLTGINSSYNTVGNFVTASNIPAAYIKFGGVYHTLLPPATNCTTTSDPALNDYSVVVGTCVTPAGPVVGFKFTKGVYTYIQPPAGTTYIHPGGINNAGVVAGFYSDSSGFSHGFVLNGTTFTSVDYPGANNTVILGINNAGVICGYYNGSGTVAFSAVPQ